MIHRLINLLKLIQVLRERGNWQLIRRSRKQLIGLAFCKNQLIQKSIWKVPFYWFYLLKGYDALVWRLETFGFVFSLGLGEEQKRELNRKL